MTDRDPIPPDDLPRSLRERLRQADDRRPFVPPDIDRAVLDDARPILASLRKRQRRGVLWRIGGLSGAAAAAAVVAAVWWGEPFRESGGVNLAAGPGERVTILDAFALARALEAGDAASPLWDATGDGSVDRRDVDALAARAVRLSAAGDAREGVAREGRAG